MRVRRWLGRKASVEAMLEFGLWLGLAHVLVGLIWTFLHYDTVTTLEGQLRPLMPAGADLAAFGLATLLWPLMLIASAFCGS